MLTLIKNARFMFKGELVKPYVQIKNKARRNEVNFQNASTEKLKREQTISTIEMPLLGQTGF